MTLEQAEQIVEYINDELDGDARVREDYSGRGMDGKTVPAIITDDLTAIGYAAGVLGVPFTDVPSRTDSMGRYDTVVY